MDKKQLHIANSATAGEMRDMTRNQREVFERKEDSVKLSRSLASMSTSSLSLTFTSTLPLVSPGSHSTNEGRGVTNEENSENTDHVHEHSEKEDSQGRTCLREAEAPAADLQRPSSL